jgi:hypothetical protein
MRLIDADALLNALNTYSDTENGNGHFLHGIKSAQEQIDDAPTIDAVPVVRGEWVVDECDTTDDVPSFSWIDFHCSECNTDYGLEEGQYGWCRYEKIPYKYCPNCGAKMESEVHNSG